ncbi:MAG: hypothetical protein AAF092_02845 [Pseudomonadota bacterium]
MRGFLLRVIGYRSGAFGSMSKLLAIVLGALIVFIALATFAQIVG